MYIRLLFLLFLICPLVSCSGYEFKQDGLYAVIKTSMGEMVFLLYYDKTPITVGNFVGLAEGTREYINIKTREKEKGHYYDGLILHRIIKGFVIQGGCPLGNGRGGPGYRFVDEFDPNLKHDESGILSMANAGPCTNGSQFFITLAPTPHLNGRHTVFGRIVFGQDVMRKIENVKTGDRNRPVDDVLIKSIRIVRVGKESKSFDAETAFLQNREIQKNKEKQAENEMKELLLKLKVDIKKIITKNSGLKYYTRKQGSGRQPSRGDVITAHYTGYLTNGKKFDSSYDRGKPFSTPIGVRRVIPGWDEAFLDMKEGEKRVLIIPHNMAYGRRGHPPIIPPEATLIFEVELISVKK
ncbi:MAG: peptidylprolyl isomerase [Spirochaetota bacterium]|nr:peptidylprolyl isomerase [Spirochaetota bacterium]